MRQSEAGLTSCAGHEEGRRALTSSKPAKRHKTAGGSKTAQGGRRERKNGDGTESFRNTERNDSFLLLAYEQAAVVRPGVLPNVPAERRGEQIETRTLVL